MAGRFAVVVKMQQIVRFVFLCLWRDFISVDLSPPATANRPKHWEMPEDQLEDFMSRYWGWAIALIITVAGFGTATAADLPVKAPPIIAAEYNWSGIYGGINAGWIEDHYHWQYTNPVPVTCCAPFSADRDTWLVGGHLGAQYQVNHVVLGVEAAIISATDDASRTVGCITPALPTGCQ